MEAIFDLCMAVPILAFAFTPGRVPEAAGLLQAPAFDLAFFASHPRSRCSCSPCSGSPSLVAFALLSARVRAFWARVRQGFVILRDRRRYFREVFVVQFAGWMLRFTAFWFLLEAFGVGGSVKNVLLVLGVNAVAALVPFTPGGAGVQQALLVKVFAGPPGATVAAYSVGQQIAIGAASLAVGFFALLHLQVPLVQGGDRGGQGGARRGGGGRRARPWRASRTSVTASGKTSPSPSGSAAPAAPPCPGG